MAGQAMRALYSRRIFPTVEGVRNTVRISSRIDAKFGQASKRKTWLHERLVRKLERDGVFKLGARRALRMIMPSAQRRLRSWTATSAWLERIANEKKFPELALRSFTWLSHPVKNPPEIVDGDSAEPARGAWSSLRGLTRLRALTSRATPRLPSALVRPRVYVDGVFDGSGNARLAIYELTDSTVQLGLVRGVQAIPILLLSPIAGSAADRYSRRTQILISPR